MSRSAIKMATSIGNYIGESGRSYIFKHLFQQRPHLGRVWLATSENQNFVLKDVPEAIFTAFETDLRPRIIDTPYLRLPTDRIPSERILVYRYLTDDFLKLVRKGISVQAKKKILKSSLRGLLDLHEQDIVHLDIKADNIMADCTGEGESMVISQVQLTDLENAGYLPRGRCIKGILAGNDNWRSPEAHLRGELNKPTDIFSFGIVCIYAMLGRVIFGIDDDFNLHVSKGALPSIIRLQRQVSYFRDKDGINGLMKHTGDDEMNLKVLSFLWEDRYADYLSYNHFSEWPEVKDESFKDLILKMMNLDPVRRIPAQEALEHPWFEDIEI